MIETINAGITLVILAFLVFPYLLWMLEEVLDLLIDYKKRVRR